MNIKYAYLLTLSLFLFAGLSAETTKPSQKTSPRKKENSKRFFSFLHKESPIYLCSYSTKNGEDGLRFMYTYDGILWKTLNNGVPFLTPDVGKSKCMHDPSIAQDSHGVFHAVWSTGLNDTGLGYASSADLIHWSKQEELPVMAHEPTTRNTWGPQLFYSNWSRMFYIIWASTIPGRFPEKDNVDNGYNHRLYYTTTRDFKTFSKTALFYNPAFSIADPNIIKRGHTYLLFVRKETPEPMERNIRYVASRCMKGFSKKDVSDPVSGRPLAENPAAVEIDDFTYLFWNIPATNRYGCIRCKNPRHPQWEILSDRVQIPNNVQLGTIFKVNPNLLIQLQQLRYDAKNK